MAENSLSIQPTLNMGIVGHVDHGKTTLTKLLSGKWTDTHSEEKKRGITIKLGYINFTIYKDEKNSKFGVNPSKGFKPIKKISIVDAPGHESFMATMISGASVMDCALLVVAADEKCPQPQTIEHLKTLEIAGIKNIILVQNKIDLVPKEDAIANFMQIKKFLSTTIYKEAPIIPISAHHSSNICGLLEYIDKYFKPENKEIDSKNSLMYVIRSFDINKPGDDFSILKGGILGGSIKRGEFKVNDEIEIKPGIGMIKEGKTIYKTINATIKTLMSDKDQLEIAKSGGSIAIKTDLDPTLTKTDSLVGQIIGKKGTLPEPMQEFEFETHLFEKIITSDGDLEIKPIIPNEPLMLIVNSYTTVGITSKVNKHGTKVKIKRPIMAFDKDRVVIFRRFDQNKWRIIGYGIVKL